MATDSDQVSETDTDSDQAGRTHVTRIMPADSDPAERVGSGRRLGTGRAGEERSRTPIYVIGWGRGAARESSAAGLKINC